MSYDQDLHFAAAEKALAERGNDTDKLLFNRAGRFAISSLESTFASVNGIPTKRRRTDMISDRAVADEMSLILSWRLGFTPSHWQNAAARAARKRGDTK